MEATIALAAQGEDNFARNDLALLEISADDHRIEVLRILEKMLNKRPDSVTSYNSYIPRFLGGGWRQLSWETNASWSKNEIGNVERQHRDSGSIEGITYSSRLLNYIACSGLQSGLEEWKPLFKFH
jgi:hypothetical protein